MRQPYRKAAKGIFQLTACILTAAALNAAASAAETAAGWKTENGKRYYYDTDGAPAVGAQEINGVSYLFAPNGAQQIGWQTVNDKRYFYDPQTFEPVFGWISWRGAEYYVSEENGKLTGEFSTEAGKHLAAETGEVVCAQWRKDDTGLHYYDAAGVLAEQETVIGGVPCLFDENSAFLTGWQTASDGITRYYAHDDTEESPIRCGWLTLDDQQYYADAERGKLSGIAEIDGADYCFDANGALQSGWYTADEGTYYLGTDGIVRKGLLQLDGDIYYFDAAGIQQSGWQTVDGCTYFFGDGNKALRGMFDIDGATYYFNNSGIMQTGSIQYGGKPFFFAEDGRRIDGFRDTAQGKTYCDPYTGETAVGWKEIGGAQYYFDAAGIMAAGIVTIDGKKCRFLDDGVYKPVKICLDAGHFAKYNHSPVNPAYWESDFNWTMHLYLKAELEKYGIEVITTRADKDTDLALVDRGKTSAGCDLFLSIHSNASTNYADDGPLACCTVTGTCDQLGLDLANLVADVMGTRQRGSIWKRFSEDWPGLNYYGVLRGATFVDTPAILLEHSYHTNLRATNWLLVDENIRKLAVAEGEFLARHFGMIE